VVRVNEGSQYYLPPTRTSKDGMSHACLYSQPEIITALWQVLISRPAEGRRLSWPEWLVTYQGGLLALRRSSPISVVTGPGVD